ncbi:FGGY carbohydrate kinase domain-containing protein-like isoform X2 [Oscarella lobularis]|uniref:FGGY carbohydrate kinase domain-containing protein-like isoform X2 n=1 Tax=Oscarella lobularis TaxID=121494 RepID=UPI003313DA64
MSHYYVGVDVGTGSARAALVEPTGRCIHFESCVRPIKTWNDRPDHYEQSSDDIWTACCSAIQATLERARVDSSRVKGVGFTGTCSLVVLGVDGRPVSASGSGDDARNVVLWMDHRAVGEAAEINATGHDVLKYVGGIISPEMQAPKLLWLKRNLKKCWDRAGHFFDLPDFLAFRCTGNAVRSLCCVICKWNYVCDQDQSHWDDSYWKEIGLGDFPEEGYCRIGTRAVEPGTLIGHITKEAALEMGLVPGTPVGASLIDAHAGGIGVLGADVTGTNLPCEHQEMTSRLALICGTSSCHMAISTNPHFVPGVWGPYFSAMVPGLWLNEGGQSATGKLIKHIISTHPASASVQKSAENNDRSIFDELNSIVADMTSRRRLDTSVLLTYDLHVLPDFHGNRSPLADPEIKGMICGLTLSSDADDLARLYLATLQGIAHGTRHIVDALTASGHSVNTIFACGGDARNPLFLQVHADVTGLPVVLAKEQESVLIGAAILGATAAKAFPSIKVAMTSMTEVGKIIKPNQSTHKYYGQRHAVFLKMLDDQQAYRHLMNST